MKPKMVVAMAAFVLSIAVFAGVVSATPGSGFTASQQWKATFDELDVKFDYGDHRVKLKTKDLSDAYVTRNTIAVGGTSGWHSHPGPSLIMVTAGEVTAYEADDPTCTPKTYRAGQGFVDHGGDRAHLIRNESDVPAETVAFQILPQGATRRIDTPASVHCSF